MNTCTISQSYAMHISKASTKYYSKVYMEPDSTNGQTNETSLLQTFCFSIIHHVIEIGRKLCIYNQCKRSLFALAHMILIQTNQMHIHK